VIWLALKKHGHSPEIIARPPSCLFLGTIPVQLEEATIGNSAPLPGALSRYFGGGRLAAAAPPPDRSFFSWGPARELIGQNHQPAAARLPPLPSGHGIVRITH